MAGCLIAGGLDRLNARPQKEFEVRFDYANDLIRRNIRDHDRRFGEQDRRFGEQDKFNKMVVELLERLAKERR